MHESEKWNGSHSVLSDSSWLHGLKPTRLFHPWDFPGKSTGVRCHCPLQLYLQLWTKPLRRNGVAIIVNKRFQKAVLGCNLKNGRMISVHFQAKPFNITVIQVYAPTNNAEEAEVEWSYEDLQDFIELRCLFHYRGLECKSRKSRNTWSNKQIWP